MKKIISVVLCVFLGLIICGNIVLANDDIEGFDEKWSALFMKNHFTQDQIAEMEREYKEWFDDEWENYLDNLKRASKVKYRDDDEKEYEYRWAQFKLDFYSGIWVTPLKTYRYMQSYSQNNCFNYLFSNYGYWSVKNNRGYDFGKYNMYGERIINTANINNDCIFGITLLEDDYEFISNKKMFQDLLKKNSITTVRDMKLFGIPSGLSFLYIESDDKEYLIKLYSSENKVLPTIEKYTLYEATEMIDAMIDLSNEEDMIKKQTLSLNASIEKPQYNSEAEVLQDDGLLYGNEKGLDLLKPLTRIEATTILVRAMGYEDAATATTSYFADIASDNWGAKYANIAYDKGIAEGVGDGLFAPNDTITASQFATLILRNLGESPDWRTAIDLFVERGLITSEQAEKMDLFTRGDMAKIIYEAKQKNLL